MSPELVFGRPQSDWYVLEDACLEFLLERARYGVLATYTELNAALVRRTGLTAFDFRQAVDRAAMGHLLGLVADRTFGESGLLISALCTYLQENGPGGGFYVIASDDEHRLLAKTATAAERMEFWADHVRKVQEHYG